jgi:tRNA G18 (ribose-2'-O)-methylase SpoU
MESSKTFRDRKAPNIKKQTHDLLSKLRDELTTPMFQVILGTKSEEEQGEVRETLKRIEAARLTLDNAELKEIANKLKENDKELQKGTQAVNNALQNLQNTQAILQAISSFLAVVSCIAPFII